MIWFCIFFALPLKGTRDNWVALGILKVLSNHFKFYAGRRRVVHHCMQVEKINPQVLSLSVGHHCATFLPPVLSVLELFSDPRGLSLGRRRVCIDGGPALASKPAELMAHSLKLLEPQMT